MTTRSEREKNKKNEKHTHILMELLRDDQNKYCADCRAKGPRWASWNLGIFVCITCAGIHRNLGVHISRVKSVNLDAWTPEQIKSMQEWGNKRAAEYYEFHLPEDFRRPQGDSTLEQFIRNKYEKKLYVNKNGPPPAKEVTSTPQKKGQEKSKLNDPQNKKISRPEPSKATGKSNIAVNKKPATVDLLSLSEATATQKAPPLVSAPPTQKAAQQAVPQQNNILLNLSTSPPKQNNTNGLININGSSSDPSKNNMQASQGFAFDLAQNMSSTVVPTVDASLSNNSKTLDAKEDLFKDDFSSGGQSKKDSIMALYQPSAQKQSNPQMFGVPGGVYLQQQPRQHMNVMGINRPQGMPPSYNQQQGMFTAPTTQQQQQQQPMFQMNQMQQQLAMMALRQQQPTRAMTNNQAMMQAGAGYNYNQQMRGMAPYNNMVPNSWMVKPSGNYPAQQATPQYVSTGPQVPTFNLYQGQAGMQSGHTLSTNLWK